METLASYGINQTIMSSIGPNRLSGFGIDDAVIKSGRSDLDLVLMLTTNISFGRAQSNPCP